MPNPAKFRPQHTPRDSFTLRISYSLFTIATLWASPRSSLALNDPRHCSSRGSSCLAYVFYPLVPFNRTAEKKALEIFNIRDKNLVSLQNYTTDNANNTALQTIHGLYISVECSCSFSPSLNSDRYFADSLFVVKGHSSTLASIAESEYQGLAWADPTDSSRRLQAGVAVNISLLCGCPDEVDLQDWHYLLAYKVTHGDTASRLTSRFGSNVTATQIANPNLTNVYNIIDGEIIYIPMNSIIVAPSIGSLSPSLPSQERAESRKVLSSEVITTVAFCVCVVSAAVGLPLCFIKKKKKKIPACCKSNLTKSSWITRRRPPGGRSQRCALLACSNCSSTAASDGRACSNKIVEGSATLPRDMIYNMLFFGRPIICSADEISLATDNFSSAVLAKDTYGTVYYGVFREQEVAIRRMEAKPNPEIITRIRSMCKLHHTSLVEIIGYSFKDNELFLIYQFEENGPLYNHLHGYIQNGLTPLTWNLRVQIALDVARGVDYVHDHIQSQYNHTNVNTRSIYLDANSRAKVANYGLLMIMEVERETKSSEVTLSAGNAFVQSPMYGKKTDDIFSFGVLLFELLTGREDMDIENGSTEEDIIKEFCAIVEDHPIATRMQELQLWVDPSLSQVYPPQIFHKVCLLAKLCLKEDSETRLDLKNIVYTLSQMVLNSIEWEATLAHNSEDFSELTNGR